MLADLTKFEWGVPFEGDAEGALSDLRFRLSAVQLAQIVHGRRVILLLDGWPGSGRKTALRHIVGSLDPCHASTVTIPFTGEEEDGRHWMAPYWSSLPEVGKTTIFYPGWYRRMAELRLDGRIDDKQFARICDEINEFEAQQRDHGTLIVKMFFHVDAERQAEALRERQEDCWRHHLQTRSGLASLGQRGEVIAILNDIFAQTDTRWAPWIVVDGNDATTASIRAKEMLVTAMEKAMPTEPPAEGETVVPFRQSRAG